MVENPAVRLWLYRWLYLGLAIMINAALLMPLPHGPAQLPGPDLLLGLTMIWAVRRPDYLPVLLIAGVFLLQDFLLSRPPGVWTTLIVLITEFLRSRWALTRELNLMTEWLLMAGLILGAMLVNRLVLALFLVPLPAFGPALVQLFWSIAIYPVMVWLCETVFNLRKPATGEADAFGRPL